MREALTADMLATDLADYLVRKGVSPQMKNVLPSLDRYSDLLSVLARH